jgi:hypothetical protein
MEGWAVPTDWILDDGTLRFGKHAGSQVEDVAHQDPGYLRWVVETVEGCSDEDREIMLKCLERARRTGSR